MTPGLRDDIPRHHQWCTAQGFADKMGKIRMPLHAAIGKAAAIAGIKVALARQSFGQDHVVAVQLHVPIGHAIHWALGDAGSIDQAPGRDQHAIDEDPMIRRQQQVTARQAGLQRAGGDTHRPDRLRGRVSAAINPPMPPPDHRPKIARQTCVKQVITAQFLHRNLAAGGAHSCTGREAGHGKAQRTEQIVVR